MSGLRRLWRGFASSPSGLVGLVAILLWIGIAVFAPVFLSHRANTLDLLSHDQGPSSAHWLGTDGLGRDILARLLVATRLSLSLALAATGLAAGAGISIGALIAVVGPRARTVAMRLIDTSLAFPAILVAILVEVMIGPGSLGVVLGIGIALTFSFARVSSTLALSIGGREYVAAARVLGVRPLRRMYAYIIPNIADTILVTASLTVGVAIVAISSLSFVGLGVRSPSYDWGVMLTQGVQVFYTTPVAALAPAAAIALSAIAFGFFGEAVARATNPQVWTARGSRSLRIAALGAMGDVEEVPDAPGTGGSNGSTPAMVMDNLVVSFPGPGGQVEVVKGVSFTVDQGESFGIVGESGSGKTMTALAIAQLVPYPGKVSGSVTLAGQELKRLSGADLDRTLGKELAVVFQDPMSSLNPALKVGTQLTEGAVIHSKLSLREARKLAEARLREVNIPSPAQQLERHPNQFSGGMRQRLMIAMGLMNEPRLLLADEPTTALDVTVQAQIMALLRQINHDHNASVILISHSLGLVAQNCKRVMVMYAGRVVEEGPTEAIIREPLHPYTRALLSVVPDPNRPRDDRLEQIPGQPPDPAELPSGCAFHPRCPLAADLCRTSRPPLVAHDDRRRVACWAAEGRI